MNLSKTNKLLVIWIVYTLILTIAYVFIFSNIRAKKANTINAVKEITALEESNSKLYDLKNIALEIEIEKNKLNNFFVGGSRDDILDFIKLIERIGVLSNTDVTKNILNNELESELVWNLNTRITASGTWDEVYTFLILLENIPYKLEINQASFKRLGDIRNDSSESMWSGGFSINVLQFKDK